VDANQSIEAQQSLVREVVASRIDLSNYVDTGLTAQL
jgi:hypothetical protein